MRLFEAILDANHRALSGDESAGLHPSEFREELPIVALTCIDPRLNRLLPEVMGVPDEEFIWLRNAGNIITGPLSSTMRSLALACAVKNGKEIVVIGHTDCQVRRTSTMQLLDQLRRLGIERQSLPENIAEFFGIFASEQQNVIKAVDIIRHSPIIGAKIPVHGMMLDITTGKLDWVANGYETTATISDRWQEVVKSSGQTLDALKKLTDFQIGEMKFPETRIGETVVKAEDWLQQQLNQLGGKPQAGPTQAPPPVPPKIPIPDSVRPPIRVHPRMGRK